MCGECGGMCRCESSRNVYGVHAQSRNRLSLRNGLYYIYTYTEREGVMSTRPGERIIILTITYKDENPITRTASRHALLLCKAPSTRNRSLNQSHIEVIISHHCIIKN